MRREAAPDREAVQDWHLLVEHILLHDFDTHNDHLPTLYLKRDGFNYIYVLEYPGCFV